MSNIIDFNKYREGGVVSPPSPEVEVIDSVILPESLFQCLDQIDFDRVLTILCDVEAVDITNDTLETLNEQIRVAAVSALSHAYQKCPDNNSCTYTLGVWKATCMKIGAPPHQTVHFELDLVLMTATTLNR